MLVSLWLSSRGSLGGDVMNLGTIAIALFSWARSIFEGFNVSFGDVTINGWLLLIGGAVTLLVFWFLARIFE